MGACPHLSRSDKKKGVWGLAPASPRSCVNELTASMRMCHTTGIPPQGEHYFTNSRGWGPFTQQGARAKEQVNLSIEVPLVPF